MLAGGNVAIVARPAGLSGPVCGSRKGGGHWSALHGLTPHEITEFDSNEETMISRKFSILSLAIGGCAAAAYAIGRHARHMQKQRLKQDLRTWEDEGGNPAPSEAPAMPRPAAAA